MYVEVSTELRTKRRVVVICCSCGPILCFDVTNSWRSDRFPWRHIVRRHTNNQGLLDTSKTVLLATQSTFRSLEIFYSKRRFKIIICSVFQGNLNLTWIFRIYKASSNIFPNILGAIWRISKVRHFLIPLSIAFLNGKKFRSPFFYQKKKILTSVRKS